MKLATAQEVLDRASLNISGVGPTATINSVLEAVTVIVENLLDTPLQDNTRLDIYSYSIPEYRKVFKPVRFYLTQAFHSNTQAMEVRTSLTGDILKAAGEGTVLAAEKYDVDETKGIVTLFEDPPEGYGSISFHYSGGFTTSADLITGIPSWMKEAAISSSIRMYEAHSVGTRRKDQRQRAIKNELASHVAMLINNHYRRTSDVFYPYKTVQL